LARRPFELATNLTPADDVLGDAELLGHAGWSVVDAWAVAATPADYRAYVVASRAEIMCPKPVYRQLRTGWFSERSACYLAAGRPARGSSRSTTWRPRPRAWPTSTRGTPSTARRRGSWPRSTSTHAGLSRGSSRRAHERHECDPQALPLDLGGRHSAALGTARV